MSGYLYALAVFPVGKEPPLPTEQEAGWLPAFRNDLPVPWFKGQEIQSSWPFCPETSVRNYRYTLSYSPEERTSHFHCGGILKSRQVLILSLVSQKFKRTSC